jgi:hypothetical protein
MALDIIGLMVRHGPEAAISSLSREKKPLPSKEAPFSERLFERSTDWDPTFRTTNRWFDRLATASRIKDFGERRRETTAIMEDVKLLKRSVEATGWLKQLAMDAVSRGERFGDIMVCLMLPSSDRVANSADRIEQVLCNHRVAFALAAYHSDHKRYPPNLDSLAPKYLDRIPDDLFSGKALIYRLEDDGYLLYSVGPNGVDDGGASFEDQPRGDDIRIRIPIPPPLEKK